MHQQSTLYSETSAISLYKDDLKGGSFPQSGENAVAFNSAELGVKFGGIRISFYLREDYSLRFTDDTFFLVYRDKNKLPIPEDEEYDVLIDVNRVQASGIRLGYDYEINKQFTVKSVVSYINASDLLYGRLSGFLSQEDDNLAGDLGVDYNYVEDVLFGRDPTPAATGEGYSIDFGLSWRPLEDLLFSAYVYDAVGEIIWDEAPYTEASISSSRTYYDADGGIHRAPIMSGRESFRELTQSLPRHHKFNLQYRFNSEFSFGVEHESYEHVHFNRFDVDYHWKSSFVFGFGVDLTSQSIKFKAKHRFFKFEFGTDETDFEDAQLLVLNMQFNYTF